MKVGPFEELMAVADDLGRADSYCEGVVRKTERQVADSYVASRAAESSRGAAGSGAGAGASAAPAAAPPSQPLTVYGTNTADYVRAWRWDLEAWDPREPLPVLVKRLVAAAERVDGELRSFAASYLEKKTALTGLERKRDGNLLVRALEDVITPARLHDARADFVPSSSEYLKTFVAVLPAAGEEAFLSGYESLAPTVAPYGEPGRRDAVHGSPVVPGSARKIESDAEGYVLYLFAGLRKFDEAIKAAAKERRITIRDFAFAPEAAGSNARAAAELRVEVDAALAALREQSVRKYGEALSLWLHMKAIRLFVESVLRYGLPTGPSGLSRGGFDGSGVRAPFAGALITVASKSKGKAVLEAVSAAWRAVGPAASRSLLDDVYGPGPVGKGKDKGESG